jgi:hypothetical protein
VDKQFYRDLPTVTADDLKQLRKNFTWVKEKMSEFVTGPRGRCVVLLGSAVDVPFAEKIRVVCHDLGVPTELRVCR